MQSGDRRRPAVLLGAALMMAGAGLGCARRDASADAPSSIGGGATNLLLITIDTLRADHLGAYGYDRPTSPALDAFAGSAVVFDRAQSTSSWTLPAMASLMTSLHPSAHGCTDTKSRLRELHRTLAELLEEGGFLTGAVTSNLFMGAVFGFAQGFGSYENVRRGKRRSRGTSRHRRRESIVTSDIITEQATAWLKARAAARPSQAWFLWVHYFDPHSRYIPHVGIAEAFGRRRPMDLYDGEIAFTDAQIGILLGTLDQLGFGPSTAVFIAADHGEEFLDHGNHGHRKTLFREVVHVPLMIRVPEVAPSRVDDVVSLVDILPTALELLGVPLSEPIEGRSLVPLFSGERHRKRPVVIELAVGTKLDIQSLVLGDWKLILDRRKGTARLFRMSDDPLEQRDVAGEHPQVVTELQQTMDTVLAASRSVGAALPEAVPLELSEEDLAELEALGYVGER